MSKYSGLNLHEVQELDVLDYLFLRREAYIDACMQTEEGREYLYKAWLLEQTKPDRKALKSKFGKG